MSVPVRHGQSADRKVFRDGTHRVRTPEETWNIIAPRFGHYGITRIADVTGLDVIGIPVAMAVRPLAQSLSVAQGKGQTMLLAKVSAAMESVEHWHAEHATPAVCAKTVPGRELHLPYALSSLDSEHGCLVTDRTPLDWARATGIVTGRTVPVPLDLVCMARPGRRRWKLTGFKLTSNGLAAGNSVPEAALHALYEVIERDAVQGWPTANPVRSVDPESIDDPGCAALVAKLRSAGVLFEIGYVPSRFRVPCLAVWIWSDDFPVTCLGFGAHLTPAVALSRALTEAAQSRLTAITGSREDLPPVYQQARLGAGERPFTAAATMTWAQVTSDVDDAADLTEELKHLSTTVATVAGCEPLLVDLSTEDDFAVLKVIVPGTGSDLHRFHAPS
ncbi:ribosomal protein S12 methylthiotransferase accessory factor [Krasilnikovia cinnamomea]|uniref:Ribosomal protein S12 methylthiotransferase accessory factor n=1 Tax=Krasilnikovia cinnamomea TaxID=349313 RepID=A0A4Q7ZL86_9ACTN|nr:YcaO-like family protein [Krasilnikovia cinnamomea]RZU51351.1 ribosomal protein S12 methylthiotransferase accessory factor [Krasilnikovia cinnamomea]